MANSIDLLNNLFQSPFHDSSCTSEAIGVKITLPDSLALKGLDSTRVYQLDSLFGNLTYRLTCMGTEEVLQKAILA